MSTKSSTLKVDVVTDAKGIGPGLSASESRFSRWGNKLKAAGKVAAIGLAAGAAVATVALYKMAKGAAEDEQAASKLAATLESKTVGATRKQVAATEDWISKQGQLLGVTDDELRPALGRLAVATGDVHKAQQLASLSMDVAAGTGKSLEAVSTALAKAQTGNVGALGRLGVATKDAAGHTLSLEQITAKLATTYRGQASKAANTTAGRFQRLKVMFSEAGEAIGYKLLPLATKFGGWVLKTAPKVQAFASDLGHKLAPAVQAIGRFIHDRLIPAAQEFTHWYLEKIAPGIKKALTPILDAARDALDKVSKSTRGNRPELQQLGDVIRKVAEFIGQKFLPVAGKVIGWAIKIQGGIWSGMIRTIGFLVNAFDRAADAVRSLVGWIGRVHFPSVPGWVKRAGGFVGFAADYAKLQPSLVGGSPGFGGPAGLATATAGSSSWWSTVSRATATARPTGGTYVDARTFVQIDGALDPVATGRQVDQLLREHRRRLSQRSPAWST